MAECILLGNGGGGLGSDDVTATRAHVLAPYTAITSDSNDEPVEGTITSVGAATHYATTAERTILSAGQYLSGDQKIGKLTASGLAAANIVKGTTISIHNGSQNVFSVAGSARKYAHTSGTYKSSASTKSFKTGSGNRNFYYITLTPGFYVQMANAFIRGQHHNSSCGDEGNGFEVRNKSDGNGYFAESPSQGTTITIPVISGNTNYTVNLSGYY